MKSFTIHSFDYSESAAAAAQRFIGNVASDNLFITLQSAGTGGARALVMDAMVQGAGVAITSLAGVWRRSGGL
jgi:hypothetical protein